MRWKIMFALVTVLILSSTSPLQAQPTTALNKQFMDILLAFPSGFNSLKSGVPKYDIKGSSFYSKVNIEGTKYCKLEKNSNTGKLEFIAMILSDDETGYNVFEESFAAWKKKIAGLDFNGTKLVPYLCDKYKDDDMYPETAAWRLDNSKTNSDPQYRSFTIWLQLLDLEQGGFMVRVIVTDN
ncbi:MAG: hypothetical protein IPM85_12615 [Chitinophagaceae bacterium]|nr:hypothetical protein [Chitinophagaceae bacterium]